jgi:hypothetical protein
VRIEEYAVEVHEYAVVPFDLRAVVAVKRRLDDDVHADAD